jgi:acetyltransferase-like isoleucine patch superfamily enzyme
MIGADDNNFNKIEMSRLKTDNITNDPITIEDGVWIGANCTINGGVTIRHDAVVAANSVVAKDVEPYDMVGGVPAKVINNRKSLSMKEK